MRLTKFFLKTAAVLALSLCSSGVLAGDGIFETEKNAFRVQFPEGMCQASADGPAEKRFLEYLSAALGKSLRLAAAAIPCDEREDFLKSGRNFPRHFSAAALVGVDGSFGRFLLGKKVYFALTSSFNPKDFSKTERRATRRLGKFGDAVSGIWVKKKGQAGDAIWFDAGGTITHEGGAEDVLRVSAGTTLVSKHPFAAFYVTCGDEDLGKAMYRQAMPILKNIETVN